MRIQTHELYLRQFQTGIDEEASHILVDTILKGADEVLIESIKRSISGSLQPAE
jgi:hypothetical protein